MKILIIKLSPINAITSSMYRAIALAKGLYELGHEIDFIVRPMSVALAQDSEKEVLSNFRIIEVQQNQAYEKMVTVGDKGIKRHLLNIARKVWHTFIPFGIDHGMAKTVSAQMLPEKKYDLIISVSDPKSSHDVVGNLISTGLAYHSWCQYWGDPLTIDITKKTIYPSFIMKKVESEILKGADKIVYTSPITLQKQRNMFPEFAQRMCFLPTPYMETEKIEMRENTIYTIGYYGAYYSRVRNIVPFYRACKAMGNEIDVAIYGDSNLVLENTKNIHVFPRGVVDEHRKITDLIVCILNSSGTQIPGKIYHEAGSNKQILVILDGEHQDEISSYLESFNRYVICRNNEEEIKTAITSLRNNRKRCNPCEKLYCKNIAEKFLEKVSE